MMTLIRTVLLVRLVGVVAALVLLVPFSVGAQQASKVARIGVLSGFFPDDDPCLEAVRHGLRELGYVEGRTHVLEIRGSGGRTDTFPALAAELVRREPDLIISAIALGAVAMKNATPSILIVLASNLYPVELGVVASLAHPGGNVTGVTHLTAELVKKRVQLVTEIVPRATRMMVLRLPGQIQDFIVKDLEAAAQQFGVQLQVIEVRRAEDLPGAFDAAVKGRAQAVLSTQGPFFWSNRAQIAQLALKHRLPSLSGEPDAPEAGVLLFYGPYVFEGCQRSARYVDRILKGAKPANLPVEQPTKIELVINLKTAKALGVRVPQPLLLRADRLVE